MISDTYRGASVARHSKTQKKYEDTYKKPLEEIIKASIDDLNRRIKDIINRLATKKKPYIASCPFYNTQNSLVYTLLLVTSHKKAFNLYKEKAWKVFSGHSSGKNLLKNKDQSAQAELFSRSELALTQQSDLECLGTEDITRFLIEKFKGQKNVKLDRIRAELEEHPIFPPNGYRKEVKKQIKELGYKIHQNSIDFVITEPRKQ